mmetsp:Transcript_29832/g.49229  ORF Transcript_29832/g.49229 Transcript_29832/m.49229 type:complete len:160 (-) Transcript_29832:194-673(-)|eukprot:CAMPEP_0119011208 /NCGR_PEP_ID=MMETSP1176-20130426/5522_1 /TAXON_ID=265551 /ORGANISM="Synedropsis recta cf, Strain CCMP1620" /LENGTH=159 /DNA_ID=CAMNT_0006963997 /DNA_START=49 /DNA_END=528 /DNA_ORIENTATION=-
MASSLFARNVARRSLDTAFRFSKVAPSTSVGSVRFASYFTPAHEYVKVEGTVGTVGITDFAQAALGDIVFVDLPEVGDEFEKGDSFGSVESVKAASDVYAPVSGTVTAINEALDDEPGMVNTGAEEGAWFIKLEMTNDSELSDLLEPAAYKEHCEAESQ